MLLLFPYSKSIYQTKFIIKTAQFYTAIYLGQRRHMVFVHNGSKGKRKFWAIWSGLVWVLEPIGSAVDRYRMRYHVNIIVNTYPAPDFLLYAYHDPDPTLIGMSCQKLVGKNPPGNFYRNALYWTIYMNPLSVRYWGSASCWYRSGSDLLLYDDQDPDPETTLNLGPELLIRIRIRIRIQSGQWIRIRIRNPDPDTGGQKWPTKVEICLKSSCFEVLGGLFWELKASSVTWTFFMEA